MPTLRLKYLLLPLVATTAFFLTACGNDDPELSANNQPKSNSKSTVTDEIESPVSNTDAEQSDDTNDTTTPDSETTATDDASKPSLEAPGGGEAIPTPTQAPISGDPAFTGSSKLSTVGLDEIFFGDTVEDAGKKAGTEWVGLPSGSTTPQCYTVQPTGGPAGVFFTVLNGRIERVDITNSAITTLSGAGVGSTQAQLFDLFGERLLETETPSGSEIMFVPTDADDREFRIIWTLNGVAASSMRAGRLPGVLTSSACG